MRLDLYLVQQGFFESRQKAKTAIESGMVLVGGVTAKRPAFSVEPQDAVTLSQTQDETLAFVGRAGYKLSFALSHFAIPVQGLVCGDFGASTGGFTDCMLQNGAKRVYAVDVGTGQLHPRLLADERVTNIEQTDLRTLTEQLIPRQLDFLATDVSFISLRLVLPVVASFLRDGCAAVCLVKPQFETGSRQRLKNGVVRDKALHLSILQQRADDCLACGLRVCAATTSPIRGGNGNIEYLFYLRKEQAIANCVDSGALRALVSKS